MEVFEGNPLGKWVWANVWKLPLFKLGGPGQSPCTFGDSANIFRTNIEQASVILLRCGSFDDRCFLFPLGYLIDTEYQRQIQVHRS